MMNKIKDETIFELERGWKRGYLNVQKVIKALLCFNYHKLNLCSTLLDTYYSFN